MLAHQKGEKIELTEHLKRFTTRPFKNIIFQLEEDLCLKLTAMNRLTKVGFPIWRKAAMPDMLGYRQDSK
jgi:hypothetical protein